MKSIVIGMGIGNLYKEVLTASGNEVITVDSNPDKGADFTSLQSAIERHKFFDTAHICTPNFTHEMIADEIAPHSRLVFIEKPGCITKRNWVRLVERHPNTRITMVKNNQWRLDFERLKKLAMSSDQVALNWINYNRVPNPGTWFTTKKLAYGGVSRDLMPHLLSYVAAFEDNYWSDLTYNASSVSQRWQLSDLLDTDYGVVNPEGTYDVDDYAYINFTSPNRTYCLTADWKSDKEDDISIKFYKDGELISTYVMGLCPEDAYANMIDTCFKNLNNDEFWQRQFCNDIWIHECMEKLSG